MPKGCAVSQTSFLQAVSCIEAVIESVLYRLLCKSDILISSCMVGRLLCCESQSDVCIETVRIARRISLRRVKEPFLFGILLQSAINGTKATQELS